MCRSQVPEWCIKKENLVIQTLAKGEASAKDGGEGVNINSIAETFAVKASLTQFS